MSLDAPSNEPVATPAVSAEPITARDAAKALADIRWKRNNPTPETPAAEPPQEIQAEQADSAPPTEEPAALPTEVEVEPAEQPPIDPPRSWSKEWKEEFAAYPRDVQEKISQREQERDTALRRSQNENAERLKGLTAKEQAAEQARLQYEQALPALMQALQSQQQGEFSDIKTMADIEKLAREDWPRYALWDAQQKKIAAVHQEQKAAQERQQSEAKKQWDDFASKEDAKFAELHPEYSDEKKSAAMAKAVFATAEKAGITREQLTDAYHGKLSFSPRMAAVQEILLKAALYDQAKASAAKVAPKPLPPVQRPGARGERVDQASLELKGLTQRAEQSNNPRDWAKVLAARRAAQR
jgi:hypothetical protein